MSLQRHQIERVVAMALEEDAPFGDVTSQTFVPGHHHRRPPSSSPGSRGSSPAPRCSRSP